MKKIGLALVTCLVVSASVHAGDTGTVVGAPTDRYGQVAIACPMLRSYLVAQELRSRDDPDAESLGEAMGCVGLNKGDVLFRNQVRGDYMQVGVQQGSGADHGLLWTRAGILCLWPNVPNNVVPTKGTCP